MQWILTNLCITTASISTPFSVNNSAKSAKCCGKPYQKATWCSLPNPLSAVATPCPGSPSIQPYPAPDSSSFFTHRSNALFELALQLTCPRPGSLELAVKNHAQMLRQYFLLLAFLFQLKLCLM